MRWRRWAKHACLFLIALVVPTFFCRSVIEAADAQVKTKIRIATASPASAPISRRQGSLISHSPQPRQKNWPVGNRVFCISYPRSNKILHLHQRAFIDSATPRGEDARKELV
jgi:hypothetical protein